MLVTKQAPKFKGMAAMPDGSFKEISLDDYLGKKKVVLFFYPLDFTFVCPTEIVAFDHRFDEFEKRRTQVIGCSVDSHFTHAAWRATPLEKGGIGAIKYPLLSDLTKQVARDYDVLLGRDEQGHGGGVALRATFLIDEKGLIRHAVTNDLPLGRNIDNTLEMVDALAFNQEHGEVCPAGWHKNKKGMKPTADGVAKFLEQHGKGL